MTPLLSRGYKAVLMPLAAWGLAVAIVVYILGYHDHSLALFRGSVIGVLDAFILMRGIRKALPFVKEPKKGLRIMWRYRWYRIISAGTIIVLLLRQGDNVALVCIGLLLTHIFFIINLTLIAYRLNKKET